MWPGLPQQTSPSISRGNVRLLRQVPALHGQEACEDLQGEGFQAEEGQVREVQEIHDQEQHASAHEGSAQGGVECQRSS